MYPKRSYESSYTTNENAAGFCGFVGRFWASERKRQLCEVLGTVRAFGVGPKAQEFETIGFRGEWDGDWSGRRLSNGSADRSVEINGSGA
jgi:hypothetical protein